MYFVLLIVLVVCMRVEFLDDPLLEKAIAAESLCYKKFKEHKEYSYSWRLFISMVRTICQRVFFFGFPKYPQVFILRLILRDTVRCQGGDLYQESLLHPQGLETETTCLSDQSPSHSG